MNIIYKDIPDEEKKGVQTWINELIWRDFYMMILHHFPHVLQGAFREKYDRILWRNDKADLQAWQNGLTGYPIVDAAMRQLKQTGWMHNRARMIVASFLCKDLLINWQLGEEWFMQNLIDGDTAANNGGWQWSAGTGTDAAPYFRIFNPITQSKKYDPEGIYIRKWLPELSDIPNKFIHTPFELSHSQQKEYGCQLGKHYPQPIVDHATARTLALAVYKAAIKGPA
jgi:deoxyribodipyrimidine photo-lyase